MTTFATESADDGPASLFKKLPLGFELAVERAVRQPENTPFEILNLHFKVLELENIFVRNLDSIDISILRSLEDGRLMLAKVETRPSPANTPHPVENAIKECRRLPLLCKWKAILATKLRALRTRLHCGGWRIIPVHHAPKSVSPQSHSTHEFGKLGGHRSDHASHQHRLREILMHVFLPIFVGVAAGMTASLLGMIVGHLIVLAWRKFGRRGQMGLYSRVEQSETTVQNEKEYLQLEADLPAYEEGIPAKDLDEKR